MKKENKNIIKNILQGNNLEMNLAAYTNAYTNAAYEYSLIRLLLNYYTVKEIQDDTNGITKDDYLSSTFDKIQTIIFQTILSNEVEKDYDSLIMSLQDIRKEMTNRMTILTAYTDALQIYEYVLNRIEYTVKDASFDVDETQLATKVFQYLFCDNDKMVVNSKIQMVTSQLPIRMTKSRFFDYLTDTLNIYQGSDESSVDDFVAMLKSTALLELPQGFEDTYPVIANFINELSTCDYKNIDLKAYEGIMEQFAFVTDYLTELVSNYLLVMEIVNDLLVSLIALLYQNSDSETVPVCIDMIKALHDAFISESEIPDSVDEGFIQIEGVQEELGEDLLQYESILSEVMTKHQDTISWMMSDKIFVRLSMIAKLLSGSLFVDLEVSEETGEVATAEYIVKKRDELVALLTAFFDTHTREVNRAVMAALFSNMPVLFNSQQEVKEYIEYSLGHCSNTGELMACAKILEDLMENEE